MSNPLCQYVGGWCVAEGHDHDRTVVGGEGTDPSVGTRSTGSGHSEPGSYQFGPEILQLFATARDVVTVASPGNAPDSLIEAVGHLERALVELGEESTHGYWPHAQPQWSDRMAGGTGIQCEDTFLATRCELSDGHEGLHAAVTDQYIALAWQVPHWA